jgi:hypothetical protein
MCQGDVLLRRRFITGDVSLRRRCVYRRLVEETFCNNRYLTIISIKMEMLKKIRAHQRIC